MIKKASAIILMMAMTVGVLLPDISLGQVNLASPWGGPITVELPGSSILGNWFPTNYGITTLPYPAPAASDQAYSAPIAPSDATPDVSAVPFKQFISPTYNFTATIKENTCSDSEGSWSCPSVDVAYDQNVGPAVEGPVQILTGIGVVNDSDAGYSEYQYQYAIKPITRSNVALVTERDLAAQAIWRSSKQVDVVYTGTDVQENFGLSGYSRYGLVWSVQDGTLPSYIYDRQVCSLWNTEGGWCEQYSTVPVTVDAIHQNGKTYFVEWNAANDVYQSIQKVSTARVPVDPVTLLTYVSPTSVKTDGKIIYMTKPKCNQGESSGWFTTTVWVDCTTYGLSADGYTGTAQYHKEDSSFGGWFGTWFIALPLALADPIMWSADGFGLPGIINLTPDAVAQFAQMPSVWGTRQDADSLGVGTWTWKGGWKIPAPTVDLKINDAKPSINLRMPNTGVTLSWTSKNADACVAFGDGWNGSLPLSGTKDLGQLPRGTENPGNGKTYTYGMTCSSEMGGSTSETVTATVYEVPVCSFSADPAYITPPQSSTLAWTCNYATECSINNGVGSVDPVKDSVKVHPTTSTQYTQSCKGIDGQSGFPAVVDVAGTPPIVPSTATGTKPIHIKEVNP